VPSCDGEEAASVSSSSQAKRAARNIQRSGELSVAVSKHESRTLKTSSEERHRVVLPTGSIREDLLSSDTPTPYIISISTKSVLTPSRVTSNGKTRRPGVVICIVFSQFLCQLLNWILSTDDVVRQDTNSIHRLLILPMASSWPRHPMFCRR